VLPSPPAKTPDVTEHCSDNRRYITCLIQQLSTLREGPAIVNELIRAGGAATPILAEALLNGQPRSVYQPRCLLVEALAGLQAHDVLVEYLRRHRHIADPELRFAEDAVINTAARELKFTFSAEALSALLEIARVRSLPGVIEALGMYCNQDSMPCFIRALESDLARTAAYDALRALGQPVKQALLNEAIRIEPCPPEHENRSSLLRRRACLRLLAELATTVADRQRLLDLLFENGEIVLALCKILVSSRNSLYCAAAHRRLTSVFPRLEWHLRDEARELLGVLENNQVSI
jgi:hypothetical protein